MKKSNSLVHTNTHSVKRREREKERKQARLYRRDLRAKRTTDGVNSFCRTSFLCICKVNGEREIESARWGEVFVHPRARSLWVKSRVEKGKGRVREKSLSLFSLFSRSLSLSLSLSISSRRSEERRFSSRARVFFEKERILDR